MREIKLIHVDMEYEAATLVSALESAEIPAYQKAAASERWLLGMPGTMGIAERGFDVFVEEKNTACAARVVNGIGYQTEFDIHEEFESAGNEVEMPDQITAPASKPISRVMSILLTILLVSLVVLATDFLMGLILK